jgi:hypothetical protein
MIGSVILGILAAFIAVVLVRTLTFKPKAQPAISDAEVSFDKDGAVNALAELIKCKTVSYSDHSREDDAEFEKLISKLPTLYPEVFAAVDMTQKTNEVTKAFLGAELAEEIFACPASFGGYGKIDTVSFFAE